MKDHRTETEIKIGIASRSRIMSTERKESEIQAEINGLLGELAALQFGRKGLLYVQEHGHVVPIDDDEVVVVRRLGRDGDVCLQRYSSGVLQESYAPQNTAHLTTYVLALIQGFEPPRGLRHLDKPVR